MKLTRLSRPSLLLIGCATGAAASKQNAACAPLSGDVTIHVPNIYPESADFALSSCKFYVGSLNNNSVVEYNPYTSDTEIIEIPGIANNENYFVCGIDYSHATGDIYISASARDPWVPTIGGNLQGPNRLIRYSPGSKSIVWQANVDSLVHEVEREISSPVAGFQDSAEDADGNAYFIAAFSHVILKIEPDGRASKFYSPPDKIDTSYGFGGAFITQSNLMVLSDAVSHRFTVFNLSGITPSQPWVTQPTGHPKKLDTALECDSLIAPRRYQDKVAICSSVLDRSISATGSVAVYVSEDGWRTSKFMGAIPTEFGQSPDIWSTAQLATSDRIYALSSALPYEGGAFPQTNSTTLVDITTKVDGLVGDLAPKPEVEKIVFKHDEL